MSADREARARDKIARLSGYGGTGNDLLDGLLADALATLEEHAPCTHPQCEGDRACRICWVRYPCPTKARTLSTILNDNREAPPCSSD